MHLGNDLYYVTFASANFNPSATSTIYSEGEQEEEIAEKNTDLILKPFQWKQRRTDSSVEHQLELNKKAFTWELKLIRNLNRWL